MPTARTDVYKRQVRKQRKEGQPELLLALVALIGYDQLILLFAGKYVLKPQRPVALRLHHNAIIGIQSLWLPAFLHG